MTMTQIEWSVENEIQLFYAMMNHKPVGINKHFQMVVIHNKLTSSLDCELYADEIWKKLETLYDLQALDESDKLPFPNNEEEFSLPQETFASLIEDRLQLITGEEEEDPKGRSKQSSRKEETRDEGSTVVVPKRDKPPRDVNDEDDQEKDAPRRSHKRARESLGSSKNSPNTNQMSSKRRR